MRSRSGLGSRSGSNQDPSWDPDHGGLERVATSWGVGHGGDGCGTEGVEVARAESRRCRVGDGAGAVERGSRGSSPESI